MSTLVNIQLGYKSSAWFTAEASRILLEGQIVYLDDQSGKYKLGNGITALSALSFLGISTTSVTSVNGQTGVVVLTKSDVGLSNVDNTSDINKPISTATQTALNLTVPYTGATANVDLGTHVLNAKSIHAKGTAGAGHLGLKHQSANITASTSESSIGADSTGDPVWKNDGNPIQNIMLRNADITGDTKTKITYDAQGKVTAGTDATTADIADSTNKRYVTDAQLTVVGNTSGTNTGNETTSTLGSTINGASSATPNDTDLVATVESSVVKKITWTNVKVFLKTYFDTIYTTTSAVASQITTALTGYATQVYVTSQGYITNVVTALGYTPENVANKSSSYTASSTTTYADTKALVDGLATKQNTLVSATNIKTINGNSVLGSGNLTISGGGITAEEAIGYSLIFG